MTDIGTDPWHTLDELLGMQTAAIDPDAGIEAMAFYGRCSTEDHQDPETSRGWQRGNAAKFVEPLGATITTDYFDIGQSRSVPWQRRANAAELLAELKNPARGWSAVVVGEGTRCWFGNQFSLIAPRFAAHGVDLWVPELGGRYDPRNPSHTMLMSVLGGMSESERQHVQARVRAAMDTQVRNEGRHQGGRAPYGYTVVDGGPHPNPSKATEGHRLRLLAVDEPAAEVVQRIFAAYLDGNGDRAIAGALNRDGVLCPSANRPEQNTHRRGDGWQANTVRAILENPRYTGYAVFGRSTKHDTLIDPDDVAAGYLTRFRRADPSTVVRSRTPAHPALITVEEFTDVQLRRRARAGDGLASRSTLERGRRTTKWTYLLHGNIRCGYCRRRMEGSPRRDRIYYRCVARTITPGSPVLDHHPRTVYLPESAVTGPVNTWIGQLFNPENRNNTVRRLLALDTPNADTLRHQHARTKANAAATRLRRLQAAIEAGADPDALIDAINRAKHDHDTAEHERQRIPTRNALGQPQIETMLDQLGDVTSVLNRTARHQLQPLYEALRLEMIYQPENQTVQTTIRPGRDSQRGRKESHGSVTPPAPQPHKA